MSESSELLEEIRDVLDSEDSRPLDFVEVLEKAAEFIEACGEPAKKPIPVPTNSTKIETCPSCNGSAAILRVEEPGLSTHVGCAKAFLRAMDGQKQCEKPPAMMGLENEEAAIGQWNSWVVERRGFF